MKIATLVAVVVMMMAAVLPSRALAQDPAAGPVSSRLLPEAPLPGEDIPWQLKLEQQLYRARALRNVGIVLTAVGVGLAIGGGVALATPPKPSTRCGGAVDPLGCAIGNGIADSFGAAFPAAILFTSAVLVGVPGIVMTAVGQSRVSSTLTLLRSDSTQLTLAPAPTGALGGGLGLRF